ncbi:restriction endonuclease [Nannocystis pusilla]|uniref:restriction endonuclease n=1 Tax=Nannocystis pusilla TaxID=889268 RepID=UPI003B7D41C7
MDEKSFVHLAADILAICYKHTQIQIMDGPGDGKRDIASRTPKGHPHVAQCKFHAQPSKTVSSRDTDELPVALLKFGCKSGDFFTTGRASAQAKREYINSYPGYDLRLHDIDVLIDLVLNAPVLRMIWLEGKSEEKCKLSGELPIIARSIVSDETIDYLRLEDFVHPQFVAEFTFGRTHQGRFHPYRPPSSNPRLEFCNGKVNCTIASISAEFLHEMLEPEVYSLLVQHVAGKIETRPVTVRVGQLELRSLSGSGAYCRR